MKKNRIAVNAKYFKASQVNSMFGHVSRSFDENKNVIPERTKHNFGTSDKEIKRLHKANMSDVKGIKSNSNTLIDAVLVLPAEQFGIAIKDGLNKGAFDTAMKSIMSQIQAEQGLTPIGYKLHLDEGHYKDGHLILNPHVHLLFSNVCTTDVKIKQTKKITIKGVDGKALRNPSKPNRYLYQRDDDGKVLESECEIQLRGRMPLQFLQGRGHNSAWARMQDIAAEHLNQYGFERGLSKGITNSRHLTKANHVVREHEKAEIELQAIKVAKEVKSTEIIELDSEIKRLTLSRDELLNQQKTAIGSFLEYQNSFFSALLLDRLDEAKNARIKAEVAFVSVDKSSKPSLLALTENHFNTIGGDFENVDLEDEARIFVQNIKKPIKNKI